MTSLRRFVPFYIGHNQSPATCIEFSFTLWRVFHIGRYIRNFTSFVIRTLAIRIKRSVGSHRRSSNVFCNKRDCQERFELGAFKVLDRDDIELLFDLPFR